MLAGYSGGWLSRFPLLFTTVRWPLHTAVSITSYALTLSAGVSGAFWLRVSLGAADALVIAAFEHYSRAHFLARHAAAAATRAARKRGAAKME